MEKEEDGAIELLISMLQPEEFFIKKRIICLNKQSMMMIIMKIINDYDEDNEWWS